jgi:hypothetical protein
MTRTGKIARLPAPIRELLNHRLFNGHSGRVLVKWLNSLPEVQDVLRQFFDGRPISPQNLSEWKNGGYRDWDLQENIIARSWYGRPKQSSSISKHQPTIPPLPAGEGRGEGELSELKSS